MMKHITLPVLATLALLGLCPTPPAQAQRFQVEAAGFIYEVDDRDSPNNIFDPSIAVGTPFFYSEVFDLRAPDTLSTDPMNGDYTLDGSFYGATVFIGDYTIFPQDSSGTQSASSASLLVGPNPQGTTQYATEQQTSGQAVMSTNRQAPAVSTATAGLSLFYTSPSPITSKAIPLLSVYDLRRVNAPSSLFSLDFLRTGSQYEGHAYGTLTSLTAQFLDPVPTLTSVSPMTAMAGSSGFTLTVNGTGFLSNSIVYWNGTALETSFVSARKLTATVPASLLASASISQVTVSIPRFATSNATSFTINGTNKWTAVAIAAGPDGKTRILWNRGDGAMTVWTLNANGSPASYSAIYEPELGWKASAFSVGPDNATHILWTNVNGAAALWTLPANGSAPTFSPAYGPVTGWTATSIATDTDNATHILWDNTDGRITLWTVPTDSSIPSYGPLYGPFAGWTAKSIATGSGSGVHVLWDNTDGRMTLWTVAANGSVTYAPAYGPISGWTATALSVDSNNAAHVLWDNTDGRMTLWTIPASGSVSYSPFFGPYAGWTAVSLSVGTDGNSHVLWDNANRRMSPWTLDTNNQFVGTFPIYGPY